VGVGEVVIERLKTEKELAREAKALEKERRTGKTSFATSGSSENLLALGTAAAQGSSTLRTSLSVPSSGEAPTAAAAASAAAAPSVPVASESDEPPFLSSRTSSR
jgi:hypothetical protein